MITAAALLPTDERGRVGRARKKRRKTNHRQKPMRNDHTRETGVGTDSPLLFENKAWGAGLEKKKNAGRNGRVSSAASTKIQTRPKPNLHRRGSTLNIYIIVGGVDYPPESTSHLHTHISSNVFPYHSSSSELKHHTNLHHRKRRKSNALRMTGITPPTQKNTRARLLTASTSRGCI